MRAPLSVLLLVLLLPFAPGAASGQDRPSVSATGSAPLRAEGVEVGRIAWMRTLEGPLVHLAPLALLFDRELRIGPLGDSHTLIIDGKRAVVGPDEPLAVLGAAERASDEDETLGLSARPVRNATGLHVPIDFLERTFGDAFDVSFRFTDEPSLEIERRQPRPLEASLRRFDQGRIATLEIEFSTTPRYRFVAAPDSLEIRLLGDRIVAAPPVVPVGDPILSIDVESDVIRITTTEGASIAEPRLVEADRPMMIVDVLPPRARREETDTSSDTETGGIRTIVLDPGHGGTETGAIGPTGAVEKDLVLLMTRDLQERLERRLGVRALLTRSGDFDIELEARTALANRNQADLFISIHLNASYGRDAHGAETYFLSREASDRLAAEAAAFENRAGRDPDDPESDLELILWDLAQSFHLAESQRFANLVQQELNLALGLRDRGVKQAPFTVLMGARMPAVLVELGFLSNPNEEAKLLDAAYRSELVDALVRAIGRFKTQMDSIASGGGR